MTASPIFEEIDWSNPDAQVSRHFTVHEAIFLKQWGRLATDADGLDEHVKRQLFIWLTGTMDPIRDELGVKVNMHDCYRPPAYNALPSVKGAPGSGHLVQGNWAASDFDADLGMESLGANCDEIRRRLLPKAEELGIRMEDRGPGAPWVHADSKPVPPGGNRYFKVL